MVEIPQSSSCSATRVALVAPSLHSLGGQAVQAGLLLEWWRCDPSVEMRFVPIDDCLPQWLAWVERIRFIRPLIRTPFYLAHLWRGIRWADVVHIFSASYWSFLLAPAPALLVARVQGKKAVLHYHSGAARDHLARWRTARPLLRLAHELVVPSEYLAGVFEEFRLTATVIPNAVDFDRFHYHPRRPLRPRLLCTRNLEPYYGMDVVIRAFAEIKRRFPSASLCLVGSGSLESSLRQLVHDLGVQDVQFAGSVARSEIPRFYEQADIFLNASRLDNLPISILEAFASGLPVVSTAPEGITHVVEHGHTGLLCPVDDWRALADNVDRLLRNPAPADSLAQNAYQACVRYRWAAVRNLWLDVYRSGPGNGKPSQRKQKPKTSDVTGEPGRFARKRVASREGEQGPILSRRDIICFANDWHGDPLSKKHLMLRLAKDNRILWINSLHNRRPRLAPKDVRRVVQKLGEFVRGITYVHPNIWVLTPLYLPFLRFGWNRYLNRILLQSQLRFALWRLGFRHPIVWTFAPTSAEIVGHLGESLIIYHCVDEFAAFSDAAVGDVRQAEQQLLKKADVVLAASLPLWERKRAANKHTYVLRHGVDYQHFRRAALPSTPLAPELEALPRPILGFHGMVADWVDIPLLAQIARRRPDWTLVLVGNINVNVDALRELANVHMLGHRPYAKLPEYLRGFDVGLLPFAEGELTHCANPLKLREYLAAGLPVIASPLPEISRFEPLVRTAMTAAEYIEQVDSLYRKGQTGPSMERSDLVAAESWEHRVEEIGALLEPWLSSASVKRPMFDATREAI